MDWRELTSHQKLCRVQLTPETKLVEIYQMIAELKSPWKDAGAAFTWNIEAGYVLKIHAMKQPKR